MCVFIRIASMSHHLHVQENRKSIPSIPPDLARTTPVSNIFSWFQRCSSHCSSTVSILINSRLLPYRLGWKIKSQQRHISSSSSPYSFSFFFRFFKNFTVCNFWIKLIHHEQLLICGLFDLGMNISCSLSAIHNVTLLSRLTAHLRSDCFSAQSGRIMHS